MSAKITVHTGWSMSASSSPEPDNRTNYVAVHVDAAERPTPAEQARLLADALEALAPRLAVAGRELFRGTLTAHYSPDQGTFYVRHEEERL